MHNSIQCRLLFTVLVALSGFWLLANTAALAQESDDTSNSESPARSESKQEITIEEIIVTAERTFFRLNTQIELATQRLYSVYNDLNEVDEFDVNCRKSDWTGTHIREQVCWPVFFENLVAENAQDQIQGFGFLVPVSQLRTQYNDKFEELRINIAQVANENPAASEALMELGKLEEALRRKKEECKDQPALLFFFKLCR